jgi:predicted acyltransferase
MEKQRTFYNKRNPAIDMMRALTMLIMIFVNDFWKIHNVPHYLEHASYGEDFMGLADVIFPCFLFSVGLSIPYAIEIRYSKGYESLSTIKHIFSRTFALLITGVFIGNSEARLSADAPYTIAIYWILMIIAFFAIWNDYSKVTDHKIQGLISIFKIIGVLILFYLALSFKGADGSAFSSNWGILGMIGFAYLFCATVFLLFRERPKYLWYIAIILILIAILKTPLRFDFGGTSILDLPKGNFIDGFIALFHIGNGVLTAFTMGGVLLSISLAKMQKLSKSKHWFYIFVSGLISLVIGYFCHHYWIVSKISATLPWLFYVLCISLWIYTLMDIFTNYNLTEWFKWIKPAGTSTLTTYCVPYLYYAASSLTLIALPDQLTSGLPGLINCFLFAILVIWTAGFFEKINIKLRL